jgi:hypothetical protein
MSASEKLRLPAAGRLRKSIYQQRLRFPVCMVRRVGYFIALKQKSDNTRTYSFRILPKALSEYTVLNL